MKNTSKCTFFHTVDFFLPHCGVPCQGQVTLFTNPVVISVCRVRACVCERDIRSQTGPSVVQLGRLNEISDSNINSSASLMRTMRGNCFSKERHYGSSCGIGLPCLQRLLGTEGLKQYTTPASTLLCSASLGSLTLGAASQEFFISLIFWNKEPKEKCTSGILEG